MAIDEDKTGRLLAESGSSPESSSLFSKSMADSKMQVNKESVKDWAEPPGEEQSRSQQSSAKKRSKGGLEPKELMLD